MEILNKLLQYANADEDIRGVILCGSRATDNNIDQFSDYDIIFTVDNIIENLKKIEKILEIFGKIWISQEPDKQWISTTNNLKVKDLLKYTYLVVFEGGLRIDLTFADCSKVKKILKREKNYKILLEKDNNIMPKEIAGLPKSKFNIEEKDFLRCANEFFWVLPYSYKGLLRHKLMYCNYHIEHCLREELLRMLNYWSELACHNFPKEKCSEHLQFSLPSQDWQKYLETYNCSTPSAIRNSLISMTNLFSKYKNLVAELNNFSKDLTEETNCYKYLANMENGCTILETERLKLRKLKASDIDNLSKILKDVQVMYAYEHAFSDEEVEVWLNKQLGRYYKDGFGLYAVELKDTGEFVGQCGLTLQNISENSEDWKIEIGYLFRKEFWKHGYATEAAIACKNLAFIHFGADEVYSIIRENNIASQNVAIRNDMLKCGELTKFYQNITMPHYIYKTEKK